MKADKVQTVLELYKGYISEDNYYKLEDYLYEANDKVYDKIIKCELISVKKITLLSIFLGLFGIDRIYIKDYFFGLAKLVFGVLTVGVLWLTDIYYITKKVKQMNAEKLFDYFY